jgi:hypothetical protein
MLRIDDLQGDIARLERQIGESRRGSSTGERTATPGAV